MWSSPEKSIHSELLPISMFLDHGLLLKVDLHSSYTDIKRATTFEAIIIF